MQAIFPKVTAAMPHKNSKRRLPTNPHPSMKSRLFMDKHTKTLPSSMKQADFMDNSTKIPHPSTKQGTFMDKSQDPGSTGTKQAEQPPAELRRLLCVAGPVSASHAARQNIP